MHARLVMPSDREAAAALARAAVEESAAELGFDEEVFGRTFEDIVDTAHPTAFVAVESQFDGREELVGFLLCSIEGFYFAAGLSTVVHVIYVTPAKRGSRAPALLMQTFLRWSDSVGGVRKKFLGINNCLHPDRTARFFERFGARRVGYELVI